MNSNPSEEKAVLRGGTPPSEENRKRLLNFLKQTYQKEFALEWEQDDALTGGFVLRVGTDVYDWSMEGRLRQFEDQLKQLKPSKQALLPLIRETMINWTPEVSPEEVGQVLTVGDGIATVSGLDHAAYGEILVFAGGIKGMVQELKEDELGCILFGDDEEITKGSRVRRSGKMAGIPVGDAYLGRVIDALGSPIDGKGDIPSEGYLPVENTAPAILDRQAVNQPMETGILAIDSMFPIGRGQRELIIGDRQTGKTAIALDTMLNQKGKDVLIVYDDLSKHAIAYRALSLLLERSPGREAYPGDVFYLHSRLLERSAHLSQERGGGSMTALPIVETQAGDVSAYIPTNIISITDGQIFLESDLFFSGQRPAVNVGISVSRVGGDAQTKAMKKAAGGLRLDLAQYREMEVFTQFSSDLDDLTRKQLVYGQGLMRLLRQAQYHPLCQHEQVILLTAALNHVLQEVPVKQMDQFRREFLEDMERTAGGLCRRIDQTGQLTDEDLRSIVELARAFVQKQLASVSQGEKG